MIARFVRGHHQPERTGHPQRSGRRRPAPSWSRDAVTMRSIQASSFGVSRRVDASDDGRQQLAEPAPGAPRAVYAARPCARPSARPCARPRSPPSSRTSSSRPPRPRRFADRARHRPRADERRRDALGPDVDSGVSAASTRATTKSLQLTEPRPGAAERRCAARACIPPLRSPRSTSVSKQILITASSTSGPHGRRSSPATRHPSPSDSVCTICRDGAVRRPRPYPLGQHGRTAVPRRRDYVGMIPRGAAPRRGDVFVSGQGGADPGVDRDRSVSSFCYAPEDEPRRHQLAEAPAR